MDLVPKLADTLRECRQCHVVSLGQFFHTLRQCLTDPVHLAMNGDVDRRQPFVIHHQRLDLRLCQLRKMGVSLGIEISLRILQTLFQVGLFGAQHHPGIEDARFVF